MTQLFAEKVSGDDVLNQTVAMLKALAGNRSGPTRPDDVQPGETWVCTATTAWQLNLWTGTSDLLILVADIYAGAITLAGIGTAASLALDTDTTLAANSDAKVATQRAIKAYVAAYVAANVTIPLNVSVAAKVAGQSMFGGA